jgi:cytidyltransferase-like protein
MTKVVVSASLDDLRSRHVRLLEEAAKLGRLTVLLWPDDAVRRATGRDPKFPFAERQYLAQAIRYVDAVVEAPDDVTPDALPVPAEVWVSDVTSARREQWCASRGVRSVVLPESALTRFPPPPICPENPASSRKKVIVTGCFDWFHSGHVRFFEEVSELGDLYAVVGHDENIRLLKGEGHPLIGQAERCYVAGSIRFTQMALVSSGMGWMDAEPEIARLRPDIYAVNEDGDKPEKRAFCEKHGLEYVVLKRTPKESLPRRMSTALRGF